MDQFLREFAYAIHTAVNETMGKTPAELFLGRKIDYAFSEISDGIRRNGICSRDIERLFEEARRNTKTKHEKNGRNIIIDVGVMCKLSVAKIKKKTEGKRRYAHHKQLQSETKKREKRGIPTDHREEDTTRRISLIQKRQRKER
ncbi:hypothetical protein TNCV_3363851 [Trichonephila clavipes]|nr:hypothetical protein TNCV_3363851 [Trichonephila clavipes]